MGKNINKIKIILPVLIGILFVSGLFLTSPILKAQPVNDFYIDFSNNGVVPIPANAEPVLYVNKTADFNEVNLKIDVYQIEKESLLNFLVYNDEFELKNPKIDTKDLKKITSFNSSIERSSGKILLPIKNNGIYYIDITSNRGKNQSTIVVYSDKGLSVIEGEKMIFWHQDLLTGKKLTSGKLTLYNTKNEIKELSSHEPDSQGIVEVEYNPEADYGIYENENSISIIRISRFTLTSDNSRYNNYSFYGSIRPSTTNSLIHVIVDRPIYKPGDTVYYKAVLRNDKNASLSVPKGPAKVKVFNDPEYPIYEQTLTISENGTIDGSFKLSENTRADYYYISVNYDSFDNTYSGTSFLVEFFRKPSYFIESNTNVSEIVSGDKHSFNIKGTYFSGNPTSGQNVKYKITTRNFYKASFEADKLDANALNRQGYGYSSGGDEIASGEIVLNEAGYAEVFYDTNLTAEDDQIIQFEAELNDGSGNPAFTAKRILAYKGEYSILRTDDYSTEVSNNQEVVIPFALSKNNSNADVSNKDVNFEITRDWWEVNNEQYTQKTEKIQDLKIISNSDGKGELRFNAGNPGSYTIKANSIDSRGNTITNIFYVYVSDNSGKVFNSSSRNTLSITTSKDEYKIGDTMQVEINSEIPNIDVFVSLNRDTSIKYQIVSLEGNFKEVSFPIAQNDIPNFYVRAHSLVNNNNDNTYYGTFASTSKEVRINTDHKELQVNIKPNKTKLNPGEEITVDIEVKDKNGNPAQTEVNLFAIDKALFELASNNLTDIFNTFWFPRPDYTTIFTSLDPILDPAGLGGGCFAEDTDILMADGSQRKIKDIKVGDEVLTKESIKSSTLVSAKVTQVYEHKVSGVILINGSLKVTPEHIVFANNNWIRADRLNIGDNFINSKGEQVEITSIEWVKGEQKVYNLTVDKYHTYFANNFYVHNQKGGGSSTRETFTDTAYWNPSIKTDQNGKASVTFKLPDNLTTWVLKGFANNTSHQFGEGVGEVKVSKNVVVSPILPNILRVGDRINLGAIAQNFTETEQNFTVSISAPSTVTLNSPNQVEISLKPNEIKTVNFDLNVNQQEDTAKFSFKMISKENEKNSDEIIVSIPVIEYGFYNYKAETFENDFTSTINFNQDINKDKSNITLNLEPSILGALPLAFEYLLDYQYGCVEQTSSKMVPAILAKQNPEIFSRINESRNLDKVINDGISRLEKLAGPYGGWQFWNFNDEKINVYSTVFAIETLLEAKKAGYKVNDQLIEDSLNRLAEITSQEGNTYLNGEIATANYGLALGGKFEAIRRNLILESLSSSDLAFQTMANFLTGDKNPETNGLRALENSSITIGDGMFYFEQDYGEYNSVDSSTALSLRAMIMAGGREDITSGAIRYLLQSKKNNYFWTNTYGTSNTVKAAIEFAKLTKEINPNYNFEVLVNGNIAQQGSVNNANTIISPLILEANKFQNGDYFDVRKTGEGKLYSTVLYKEFITDRNYQAQDNGIKITKEIVNTKGPEYELGIGDIVEVRLSVSNSTDNTFLSYAVIADELPAGLVPINTKLRNESFNEMTGNTLDMENTTSNIGAIYDSEFTQNGVVITIKNLSLNEKVYSYKARVISEGTFITPPTFASFMYSPSINGNTETMYITTYKESKYSITKLASYVIKNYGILILQVVLGSLLLVVIPGIIAMKYILRKEEMSMRDVFNTLKENFLKTFRKWTL